MGKKLKYLQDKASKKGWNLAKIMDGEYRIWINSDGKTNVEEEYKINLYDVELFIQKARNLKSYRISMMKLGYDDKRLSDLDGFNGTYKECYYKLSQATNHFTRRNMDDFKMKCPLKASEIQEDITEGEHII